MKTSSPRKLVFLSFLLVSATAGFSADGQESDIPDKSKYTLFNPTPKEQLREWRTDQPGVSPYTADAGHFEAEISAFRYSYKQDNSDVTINLFTRSGQAISTTDTYQRTFQRWDFGAMTLKLGLLNNLDAEVRLVPYSTITSTMKLAPINSTSSSVLGFSGIDRSSTVSGFGNTVGRLKLNTWGNDEGPTALSISGQVKFPTAAAKLDSSGYEGGPSLEFAAKLPYGFKMRIDSYVNLFDAGNRNIKADFENLISLAHQILGGLEGYCMFDTWTYSDGQAGWNASIVTGANYRLCQNVELFAGSAFGVKDSLYDYTPFLGVNVRF